MGLDITEQALRRFVEEAGPGPVTLVNLVRLRPDGEEAYRAYLEAIGPCIADVGAEAVKPMEPPLPASRMARADSRASA